MIMSLYTKPASETPFGKLPPELATVIFDLVSANCRPNAARCRLVCQEFHTLCSPFLIRTIVIAERYKTLRKARELLLHPYFSKHITHLLWDASYYDQNIAADYREYEAAFNRSKHVSGQWNHEYSGYRRADSILQRRLRCMGPPAPSIPPVLRGTGRLVDYDVPAPVEDERGRPIRRHSELSEGEDDTNDHPEVPQSRRSHSVEFQEMGYLQGCHFGHSDYFRRWVNQESIRGRDPDEVADYEDENGFAESEEAHNIASGVWDIDGNLAQFYFLTAIDELPNLRHIIYGDYRALAYDGETYVELCRRLFKRTVCPRWIFTGSDCPNRFVQFMYDLMDRQRTWKSVSIGRHPFETSHVDQGVVPDIEDPETTAQSDVTASYAILFTDQFDLVCPKLQVQSLKLPTLVTHVQEIESFGRLSKVIESGLVELDLGVSTFVCHAMSALDSMLARSLDVFQQLLVPPQPDFPSLQSVTLRGFQFDLPSLQKFLLSHASKLRTLRLIDCYCPDSHETFEAFAKDLVALALSLTGVELYGLRFKDAIHHVDGPDVKEYRLMRQNDYIHESVVPFGRPSTHIWYTEELKSRAAMAGIDMVSGWPYERPELEAAMLGGRKNNVVRRMHTAPTRKARDGWYDVPISYE